MSAILQHSIPFSFAKKNHLLLCVSDEGKRVLCDALTPFTALMEVQRFLGYLPEVEYLQEDTLQRKIEQFYSDQGSISDLSLEIQLGDEQLQHLITKNPSQQDLLDHIDDAPIVRLINGFFSAALKQNASDIHVEHFEQSLSIRYRIDGVLQPAFSPDYRLAPLLVSRLKVMAKLDIAEKRLPQDGRITVHIAGRPIDVRVSTLPTTHGERVVLRILDKRSVRLDLHHLGMPDELLAPFNKVLQQPDGIILVTGPTGSGKTTTLYAALEHLNQQQRNILTIEDPVEYDLNGIGQSQVNSQTGFTFAAGLRAILRQDPDVVLIGEIRDPETASIAVQASLTGHLVLSTLHTNDAKGAVARMVDMGVEKYLLQPSLRGVLAQRLVRRLCGACKKPISIDKTTAELLKKPSLQGIEVYEAEGCTRCSNTGYTGRTGIYEFLMPSQCALYFTDDPEKFSSDSSLLKSGLGLLLEGVTSSAELLRTVRSA